MEPLITRSPNFQNYANDIGNLFKNSIITLHNYAAMPAQAIDAVVEKPSILKDLFLNGKLQPA